MKKIYNIWPYLLAMAAVFYLLPLVGKYLGSEMLLILLLLFAILIICVVYGLKNGFNLLLPLCVGVIFWPSIYLFYNSTAWIFVVFFAVVALFGNGLGSLFRRR